MDKLNFPDRDTQVRIATALEGILESLTQLNTAIAETITEEPEETP